MTVAVVEKLEFMVGDQVIKGLENMIKASEMPPAIPIEQIKGDIARQGHPVQRLMALDPDARRLFFTDIQGSFMYAEFAPAEEAYRVTRVGHQADIIKEYDVVDLEPEPRDKVTTTHEEAEIVDPPNPGVIPSGTPSDKPETDDRWLGNEGFGDEEHEKTREPVGDIENRYEHNIHPPKNKALMDLGEMITPNPLQKLGAFVTKQPPHPGLVPQSGDPQHPGRWIRPSAEVGAGPRQPSMTGNQENAIKEAVEVLTQQFRGGMTPEKAEFAAGDLWQNLESARKNFKNRKEFQEAVGAAAKGDLSISTREGRPGQYVVSGTWGGHRIRGVLAGSEAEAEGIKGDIESGKWMVHRS